jgi:phosphoribosylamine--glycine ligase
MRALLVGGGGREHAIAVAMARYGAEIHAYAKTRNPGIARLAKSYRQGDETDPQPLLGFAAGCRPDLAVIGPEAPLAAGIADRLRDDGIPVLGPGKEAARIETSKSFARALLDRHQVPGRIGWALCSSAGEARDAIRRFDGQVAVKPIGLTGGKGVKVSGDHLPDEAAAVEYAAQVISSGSGGEAAVLVEEKLEGEEFSLQALASGSDLSPFPLAQDHKRLLEGDRGPNTGGMGSYSDADHLLPFISRREADQALGSMRATLAALVAEGHPFHGVLYGQFMLARDGPRIVEFNARFADPESMNVLSILESPATEAFERAATGRLAGLALRSAPRATVCRYLVPEGYGHSPIAGQPVEIDEPGIREDGNLLYFAAVEEKDGKVSTGTSRALALVGQGATLEEAEARCSASMGRVKGRLFHRRDIGTRAMVQQRVEHMERIRAGA